ncbi:hypothetical protein R7D97_16625 [Vibrio sp. Vb5031]|uniref:hypothetical protein n=1 Tax=Vibrio sp. Vb5031 TaxID=3074699 RepID=UPI0029647A3A|nr:hypothetical protein [Vibrio sp. Vb5031]MDW1505810.1 hypothetical protein [Vibrio sp. Vb5031]
MHWVIGSSGVALLIVHYLIEQNVILNTFGWIGIGLGVAMWWHNEKELIAKTSNKKM